MWSMTWFKNTPSTRATYSSRLVPFPAARGPNVLTWNRRDHHHDTNAHLHRCGHKSCSKIYNKGHALTQVTKGLVMNCSRRGVKISFSILQLMYLEKKKKGKKKGTTTKIRLGNRPLNVEVEINESLCWHGKKIPSWRGKHSPTSKNTPEGNEPQPPSSGFDSRPEPRRRRWKCPYRARRGRDKASGGGGRGRGPEQPDKKPVQVAQLLEQPDPRSRLQ